MRLLAGARGRVDSEAGGFEGETADVDDGLLYDYGSDEHGLDGSSAVWHRTGVLDFGRGCLLEHVGSGVEIRGRYREVEPTKCGYELGQSMWCWSVGVDAPALVHEPCLYLCVGGCNVVGQIVGRGIAEAVHRCAERVVNRRRFVLDHMPIMGLAAAGESVAVGGLVVHS